MQSQTKQSILYKQIGEMVEKEFKTAKILNCKELTEGFFNVAYEVNLEDNKNLILKIAPAKELKVMRSEENIMKAEVLGLRLIKEQTSVPVPKVYAYDDSYSILEAPYFFMEKLEGQSLFSYKEKYKEYDDSKILYEAGKLNFQINEITGDKFGCYAREDRQTDSWFEAFYGILEDTFLDANDISLDRGIGEKEVLDLLKSHKKYFEEVKVPRFVHWDLWDGNIFIKDDKITGLIDFERCMFGDPLIEAGFRCYAQNKNFLEGYGKTTFSKAETIRMRWYDVYVFSIMSLEYDFRKYESKDGHNWAVSMLIEALEDLRKK